MKSQVNTFASLGESLKGIGNPRLRDDIDLIDLIDQLPHGLLLIDSSLRVVTLNRYLEALTGYVREKVEGIQCDLVLRSNFAQQQNPFADALETREKIVVEGDMINRARKKIQIRCTVSPLRFLSGDIVGAVVFIEDISLLKDLDEKVHGSSALNMIIGHSRKMQEVFDMLPVVARTDTSILITGETGTGKDYIAEAIHKASRRAKHPFVKVNCGALPPSLLESELFGHVRGAFTGAERDRSGMFSMADHGTIFLTEIGDLPLSLQIKLLTVLDDREFYPVGGSKKVKVDVRIIAATHRDLSAYVREGRFREDLFYRLNVLRLPLPPLRERGDDVRLLLDHFLREFSKELNRDIKGFASDALAVLCAYDYPGNVRELRNIVEYAVNLCSGGTINPEHLPGSLKLGRVNDSIQANQNVALGEKKTSESPLRREKSSPERVSENWAEVEKKMILDALIRAGGSKSRAAGLLGWSRTKLWRKIKAYSLS